MGFFILMGTRVVEYTTSLYRLSSIRGTSTFVVSCGTGLDATLPLVCSLTLSVVVVSGTVVSATTLNENHQIDTVLR